MSARSWCALAIAASLTANAHASDVRAEVVERARIILERVGSQDAEAALDVESAIPQLAMLGVGAMSAYVATFVDRTTPAARRAAAIGAVRMLPSNLVGPRLRVLAGPDEEPCERVGAVRFLSELGHASSLDAWLELALDLQSAGLVGTQLEADVAQSLRTLLRTQPETHARLARTVPRFDTPIQTLIVQAVDDDGAESGIEVVERVLVSKPKLEPLCVPVLARLCAKHPGDEAAHALDRLRPLLDAREPAVRQRAALALGRARDGGSMRLLVTLLGDAEPLVARSALVALRELSGHAWPADPERWYAWCEAEEAWERDRLAFLLSSLDGPSSTYVLRTIEELARHPVRAHTIARALARVLPEKDGAVAMSIVRVLGALRSGAALPGLRACAERDEAPLARGAREALAQCGDLGR